MITFKNIILFGLSYRVIVYLTLCFFPFFHSSYGNLSPLSYQEFTDLNFYLRFGQEDFDFINFFNVYKNIIFLDLDKIDNRYPGPLFPLLLSLTFYKINFTVALSIVIFLFEIFAYLIWSFKKFSNYSLFYLFVFSVMPIPLYYGFKHSTDIIFYLLFTLLYFELTNKCRNKYIFIIYCLLACLRPNCVLIFFSVICYSFISKKYKKILILTSVFFLITIFYYSPYFIYEMNKLMISGVNNSIFTIEEFFIYIFNDFKKVIFLLGFAPSASGNNLFYLLRCFCGVVFLIGFIKILYSRENKLDLVFVCFFVLGTATLFYPAYRYIIPITPILILNFCHLFDKKFIN